MDTTHTEEIPPLPLERNSTETTMSETATVWPPPAVQAEPVSVKKIIIWSLVSIVALPVVIIALIFTYGLLQGIKEVLTNSSEVKTSNTLETTFISEEKDFRVTFPWVPLREIEETHVGSSNSQLIIYIANVKAGAFLIISGSLPISKEDILTLDTKQLLNASAEGAVRNGKTKIDSLTFGKVGDYPSVDVFHSNNEIVIHQRIVLIGSSLYQLIVSQEKAKADDSYKEFFNSFVYTGTTSYSPSIDKNSMATGSINMSKIDSKKVTFKEFFPLISGNIADYEVTIPKDYIVHYVSVNDRDLGVSPFASNSLVGVSDTVDDLLAQAKLGGSVSFKHISRGVFRARFTATTGLDEQGHFVDKKNGTINELMYKNMGMSNIVFKNGLFRDIQRAPMITITGDLQGSHVRMLYLYSPVDNLVILFSLQGGNNQADDDALWSMFTNSF